MFVQGPITDAGLAELTRFESARDWSRLGVLHSRVTDSGIQVLAQLPQLRQLSIAHQPRFTGAGLAHLKGMKLEHVGLEWTGVRDVELAHLKQMPALEDVWIPDTGITDAGLEALAGIMTLRQLNVMRTQVTALGVKRFRSARPDVNVSCDFDDK